MSSPFYNERFVITQPDGTQLNVRGWGDQHYAVFETLDGYTITKDPITGFYQYATVSADQESLQPTGIRPGLLSPEQIGVEKGVRINPMAAKSRAESLPGLPSTKTRWETRRENAKRALQAVMHSPIAPAPPTRQTVGTYVGLCLLVQFPDVPGTIPTTEVELFCNQAGYSGYGNNGSVYDYFYDNSGGRLQYTSIVTPYYTTKHPRSYYTNPLVPMPDRTYELIKEALDYWVDQGMTFEKLTSDDADYVYALNVFYAGKRVNNWAEGLWPHSFHLLNPYALPSGKQIFDYQITDMDNELTLGTFCHENGHMVCDFPDLYDYGYESKGVGSYCLMGAGGNVDKRNPTQIGAYLKNAAGWTQQLISISQGLIAEIEANTNTFYIHRKNIAEYFIIENRHRSQRDAALPGSGLAIWHVDELGSNNNEQMSPTLHYECSLMQADGQYDLEQGVDYGDQDDLYHLGINPQFADGTQPSSKWWDGTLSKLDIYNIGTIGKKMKFYATV